jgi:hypothetical protein
MCVVIVVCAERWSRSRAKVSSARLGGLPLNIAAIKVTQILVVDRRIREKHARTALK